MHDNERVSDRIVMIGVPRYTVIAESIVGCINVSNPKRQFNVGADIVLGEPGASDEEDQRLVYAGGGLDRITNAVWRHNPSSIHPQIGTAEHGDGATLPYCCLRAVGEDNAVSGYACSPVEDKNPIHINHAVGNCIGLVVVAVHPRRCVLVLMRDAVVVSEITETNRQLVLGYWSCVVPGFRTENDDTRLGRAKICLGKASAGCPYYPADNSNFYVTGH